MLKLKRRFSILIADVDEPALEVCVELLKKVLDNPADVIDRT